MTKLIDSLVARFVRPQEPQTPIQRLVEDTRTTLPSGFIKRIVDLRDSTPELTRRGQPGYIHLSELVTLCARQHALMVDSGVATEIPVTGAHRVMWKIGRAVENHVRNQLVDGLPMDVFGQWVCACGTLVRVGHKPHGGALTNCRQCLQAPHNYRELTLFDHENGVTGNPDVIIRNTGRYVPIEIKSMERGAWTELRMPKANHIMQAAGYRRLLQVGGFPVHDDVVIIYVSKDFAWGSPYKEFHVRVTAGLEEQLDTLFAEARLVKDHIAAGTLPPRVHCTHITGRRAKACPVGERCFARN